MLVLVALLFGVFAGGCSDETSASPADRIAAERELWFAVNEAEYRVVDKRQAGAERIRTATTETVPCPDTLLPAICHAPATRTVTTYETAIVYTFVVEYEDLAGRFYDWTGRTESRAGADLSCYREASPNAPLPPVCR
ncbi:MAG: hypothetical protein WD942_09730 [Dehalococcoidia bacterium]